MSSFVVFSMIAMLLFASGFLLPFSTQRTEAPPGTEALSPVLPSVTTQYLSPTILGPSQSQIRVEVRVSYIQTIDRVSALLESSGQGTSFPLVLSDGTPENGKWTGIMTVPANVHDGTYNIGFDIYSAGGAAANGYHTTSLPPMAVTMQRQNTGTTTTTTTTSPPPSVRNPTVSPSTLSGGQSQIRVTASILDNTGVSRAYAYLQGVDQNTLFPLSRLDGTAQSGTWAGSYNIPANALNGVYTIGFNVYSNGGAATNGHGTTGSPPAVVTIQRTSSGTTSNPSTPPTSTTSISSVDNQPPVISSPTVSPSTLTSGQSQITVTAHVSDNVGVQRVTADISSETGLGGSLPGTDMTFSRISGNAQSGLWMGTYTFPATIADGRYRVNIKAADGAIPSPNSISSTDSIATLQRGSGSGTTVSTITPPSTTPSQPTTTASTSPTSANSVDIQPPVITSPKVQPASLTAGQSQITVTAHVSDNSGVQSVAAYISPDSIPRNRIAGTDMTLSRISGTPQNGEWVSTYTFPSTITDGRYIITIKAYDNTSPSPNSVDTDSGTVISPIVKLQRASNTEPATSTVTANTSMNSPTTSSANSLATQITPEQRASSAFRSTNPTSTSGGPINPRYGNQYLFLRAITSHIFSPHFHENNPMYITTDSNGRIYFDTTLVADRRPGTTGVIQKFTNDGQYITAWGSYPCEDINNGGSCPDGHFSPLPAGVAADSLGNIYVSDRSNNRIQKFSSDGHFIEKWYVPVIGTGTREPQPLYPHPGALYIPQEFISRIGNVRHLESGPIGIAIDSSGNVYVTKYGYDTDAHHSDMHHVVYVQKFNNHGQFLKRWEIRDPSSENLNNYGGVGITIDSLNRIYVISSAEVQKFTNDGKFITKWGSYGTGDGQFENPHGIAVDSLGNVYVTDVRRYDIQKFTNDGQFITKWGSRGSGDGQFGGFAGPWDIAIDSTNKVYVTDPGNYRVQIFEPSVLPDTRITSVLLGTTSHDYGSLGTVSEHIASTNAGTITLNFHGSIFNFQGPENAGIAGFECRLSLLENIRSTNFVPCNKVTFPGTLSRTFSVPGRYIAEIRAFDRANPANVDPTPANFTWVTCPGPDLPECTTVPLAHKPQVFSTANPSEGLPTNITIPVENPATKPALKNPVADAGSDVKADAGQQVTLNGAKSKDPNPGESLSYSWVQLKPSKILAELKGADTANPVFIAPTVDKDTVFVFKLTVTGKEGAGMDDDTVQVSVKALGKEGGSSETGGGSQIAVGTQGNSGDQSTSENINPDIGNDKNSKKSSSDDNTNNAADVAGQQGIETPP